MLAIEFVKRPQLLNKKNGRFIRELAQSEGWMLEAALDGRLVSNLTSLEVHGLFDCDRRFRHDR